MSMKKMLGVVAAAACVAFAAPAFAANPFSDVPMHHWAYDAVDVLAAHGVITGYPDGTFKGNKPITRYEMAMMVARAMGSGALSGEDSALLKKLMVEFKDELDNLGVRMDTLEGRMNAVEAGMNGWQITGQIFLDAQRNVKEKKAGDVVTKGVDFTRWRLWMKKTINDNVKFTARLDANRELGDLKFGQFYVDVTDAFFGTNLTVGKFPMSWEDDDGLVYDNAFVHDATVRGLRLSKTFSAGEFQAFVGGESRDYELKIDMKKFEEARKAGKDYIVKSKRADWLNSDINFVYGLRFKMAPTEKFWVSLNALFDSKLDSQTYWAALGFKFADAIELKGAYYHQNTNVKDGKDLSANAWKAVLSVEPERLGGYTSLWLEYAHFDKGFKLVNGADTYSYILSAGENIGKGDTDAFLIAGEQKWTDAWSTFARFANVKTDMGKHDETVRNWTVGVTYTYNPNLKFQLAYDKLTYKDVADKDENVLRLRTTLTF